MLDLIYEIDVRFDDGSVKKRVVFTQPGMRYSLSKALVHSLLDDPTFNELSEKEKKHHHREDSRRCKRTYAGRYCLIGCHQIHEL